MTETILSGSDPGAEGMKTQMVPPVESHDVCSLKTRWIEGPLGFTGS